VKNLFVVSLIVILLVGILTSGVCSATYPEKEIRWILWSSPGGGSDRTSRTVGIPLRKALGVPLVIVNMSGGSGTRAMTYVQNQKADGYTWLFITATLITSMERGLVDYELEDFVPVFMLNHDPQAIVAPVKGDIKTIEDLVKLGKKRKIKWGLTHLGGNDHVAIHSYAKMAGIKYDPIVFQSGAEEVVGALGGVIDVFIANPSEVMGQVEAGTLKVLSTMSERRLGILPEVPTLKEKGYDAVFGTWRGIAVKKGTDQEIVKALEKYFYDASDSDVYRDFLKNSGMDYNVKGSDEFKAFIEKQYKIFAEGIKEIGLVK